MFAKKTSAARGGDLLGTVRGLRAVLDSVNANVFVADNDLKLVFANKNALATCETLDPEIRRAFNTGVAEHMFGSIHKFHRDAARVDGILRGMTKPHPTQFSFGPVTLQAMISRVTDESGTGLGFVVFWQDITAQATMRESAQVMALDLARGSAELTERAAGLSDRTRAAEEKAAGAAGGTEQMTISIQAISSNTTSVATVAGEAVQAAESAAVSIDKLDESSKGISTVVALIESIAAQTNLLALNATIEAARAGEAGKGFAVVAQEVKELAQETASATQRVAQMIESLQENSTIATSALRGITGLITRISEMQLSIAGAVEEQSATTNEISSNIGELAQSTTDTSNDVAWIADSAVGIATSAESLRKFVLDNA